MAPIQIERLTHHGMGRSADGQLFARCLPGETVDADGRIITPSAHRVAAPCRHFKSCGGCAVQHGSDDLIAEWKAGIVQTALAAHGIDIPQPKVHTSPVMSRRRAKFSGRRTKKGALVGFHARASDTVIEIPGCQVLNPALTNLIPALEELATMVGSRKGKLAITATHSAGGVDVHVSGAKDPTGQDRIETAHWADRHDIARLTLDDDVIVTRVRPAQRFGAADVVPPPGAFLQATPQGEAALVSLVGDAVSGCRRVVDLFAGCGTFSLPLAQTCEVHAVEYGKDMLAALDDGWRHAQGLRHVTTEARDLFRNPLDPDELSSFDAAVVDPPRAGAAAQIAQLAESQIGRIAYVSCNPVSFAKDAARLIAAGYRLDQIDVVDQFRWSPHVELVAAFAR